MHGRRRESQPANIQAHLYRFSPLGPSGSGKSSSAPCGRCIANTVSFAMHGSAATCAGDAMHVESVQESNSVRTLIVSALHPQSVVCPHRQAITAQWLRELTDGTRTSRRGLELHLSRGLGLHWLRRQGRSRDSANA